MSKKLLKIQDVTHLTSKTNFFFDCVKTLISYADINVIKKTTVLYIKRYTNSFSYRVHTLYLKIPCKCTKIHSLPSRRYYNFFEFSPPLNITILSRRSMTNTADRRVENSKHYQTIKRASDSWCEPWRAVLHSHLDGGCDH